MNYDKSNYNYTGIRYMVNISTGDGYHAYWEFY